LLHQYGLPRTALSLDGEEFQKQALITDEWTLHSQTKRGQFMIFQQMKCPNQCFPICIPWPMFVRHFQLGQHQWREAFQK